MKVSAKKGEAKIHLLKNDEVSHVPLLIKEEFPYPMGYARVRDH